MGIGAAFVFPSTLSIISSAFTERTARAKAIGLWGATGGLGVALDATGLDVAGLLLSSLAIGILVWTIIEAPAAGWTSRTTLTTTAISVLVVSAFVRHELRTRRPMLDVHLFRNLRFTAASGAVGSLTGVRLAVRIGNNRAIAGGLTVLAIAFAWASTAGPTTPYVGIAAQMLLIGVGMGFTSAPATEATMGALPSARAGIGSAVNDAPRQLGRTLEVAVVGSVFASLYADSVRSIKGLPETATHAIEGSFGAATAAAARIAEAGDGDLAAQLLARAEAGFFDGLQFGCLVAAAVALTGAAFAALALPARPLDERVPDVEEMDR